MKEDNKIKKLIGFNRFTLTFIFIYFLIGTGTTYAYLRYQVENDSVIVGNIISIDADLEVELVVGSNTKMVPMLNDALSNAINGIGSNNGACIDSVGNLSCQVYKITLINNGSRLQHLNGTIELYPKDGSGNAYTNLKWRELTNTTTIKTNSIINGMSKSNLVSDLTMESKETKIWYIAVWISETDYDQVNTDKGDFGGTVTFENANAS